jgi:CBS domain containing-hemolysin-like protein
VSDEILVTDGSDCDQTCHGRSNAARRAGDGWCRRAPNRVPISGERRLDQVGRDARWDAVASPLIIERWGVAMTALLLAGMLALIMVNAFFVAAEFSLVRARRTRLEQTAEGDRRAQLALREIKDISEYLAACQLGVTFASVGIGFLGEPAIAELIHPWLGGALSHGLALAISLTIAYVLTTALHITIGEQVPKLFAISRAEAMARAVARPLHWFAISFRPVVSALNGASNAILRLLRVDPAIAFEEGGTPEDLKLLITQSLEGGQLAPDEALMLAGVFELHELQSRQVMTPITRVVMVEIEAHAETAARLCIESGHTRLLVTEDSNPDLIKGVIHANSLLRLVIFEGPRASIKAVVRDALIVPETKPLDTLLAELRRTRNTIAVVVDEYGRTAGIVAIEDIVEEIVGEIADETDPAAGPVRKLEDGEWLVRGDVALGDLPDYGIELNAETEAYNSVAGLVLDTLGHLPQSGDRLAVDGFTLTIESVNENRIETVRVSQRGGSTTASTE